MINYTGISLDAWNNEELSFMVVNPVYNSWVQVRSPDPPFSNSDDLTEGNWLSAPSLVADTVYNFDVEVDVPADAMPGIHRFSVYALLRSASDPLGDYFLAKLDIQIEILCGRCAFGHRAAIIAMFVPRGRVAKHS